MKKLTLFSSVLALLFSSFAVAQNPHTTTPQLETTLPVKPSTPAAMPESQRVIWSENFSNGIPSTWSQTGTPSNALWEYRGPNTTPNDTVGSRGAFAGDQAPIASTTRSNGFIIFDSSFLDNAGISSPLGTGIAPAPHVGRIFTNTIDLSNENAVEIKIESYLRRFQAAFFVAFSTDGGTSYNDTIEIAPLSQVAVNASSGNADVLIHNVSNIIGGQSQVVIQFIFDGTPGNANGNGYYFWMLDDIELREAPDHRLEMGDIDMVYDSGNHPRYGVMHKDQIVPLSFEGSFKNTGMTTQSNARLEVEIWDNSLASPSLVTTLSAPGCASLASQVTCPSGSNLTPQWTPPNQAAEYLIVYKAVSDSVSSGTTTATDTVTFAVSDSVYCLSRGVISNYVGTNSANSPIIAMGVTFSLENGSSLPGATPNTVYLEGLDILFSGATDQTGDIRISIYDTTGFAIVAGFPGSTQPVFNQLYSLSNKSLGGSPAHFSFVNNNQALALPAQTYMVVVSFFPNAPGGVIRVANDASLSQPGIASVMQLQDGNWFSGFTASAYVAPHICLRTSRPGTVFPSANIPSYPIGDVTTNDASGVADSLGVECKLEGVVHSTNFRFNGLDFMMYDSTGAIGVFSSSAVAGYSFQTGDSIRVIGSIGQFRGRTRIEADSIVRINSATIRPPKLVTTLDESTENDYIQLDSVYLVNPLSWPVSGSSLPVDIVKGNDTLIMVVSGPTNVSGSTPPSGLFNVRGAGSQFSLAPNLDDGYRILPSSLSDIILLGTPPPPSIIPTYPIGDVTTNDAGGVADSIGVECKLVGVAHSINFRSSGLDFMMYDSTGAIGVFSSSAVAGYNFQTGDSIRVIGTIGQFRGRTQIVPDSIVSLGNVNLRAPKWVTTLDESTENDYIQIDSVYLANPAQWPTSGSANVDIVKNNDTLTMRLVGLTGIPGTPAPAGLFNVRGAGSQFSTAPMLDDGYQILPSALSNIINLSLHNYRVQNITVYPNPARDMLYIESGHTGNKEAEVMSLDGKLLLRHSSNASTVELSLVDLPSGLYILKVKNLGSNEVFRIVVQ